MTKRFLVVMSLVAAAAVLWAAWPARRSDLARSAGGGDKAARASAAHTRAQDSQATDLKLALLQAQVTGLQAQLAGKAGPAPAPERRTSEEIAAAETKAWHELIAQTEATFQAEARDPRWSQETSTAVRAAVMESGLLRAAFQNLDCRSSMCRVEMLDDRSPEFMTQLQNMILRVGPALPTMRGERVTRPDGSKTTIYYLSRES